VLQIMRTSERLTIGSNRSLRSLGRAKARPLTKTLGSSGKISWFSFYPQHRVASKSRSKWHYSKELVYAGHRNN